MSETLTIEHPKTTSEWSVTKSAEYLSSLRWTREPVVIMAHQLKTSNPDQRDLVGYIAPAGQDVVAAWRAGDEIRQSFKSMRVFPILLKDSGYALLSLDKPGSLLATAKVLAESRAASSDVEIPVPRGLEYLPFQKAGIAYARTHKNVLFGDEMGLGKTIQAIGVCNDDRTLRNNLVICPAYLKLNWASEIRKWHVGEPEVLVVNAGEELPERRGRGERFVIINYDILQRYPDLSNWPLDCVIIDECHYIKNPSAKRTAAIMGLRARRFLALSGTPALNRPIELYPVTKLMMGKSAPTYWRFAKDFCNAKKNFMNKMDVKGVSNPFKLQQYLRTNFMVRRLKKDVLKELPPKMRQLIELPPSTAIKMTLDIEAEIWKPHEDTIAELRIRRDEAEIAGDDDEFQSIGSAMVRVINLAFHEMSKVRKELSLLKVPMIQTHLEDAMHENLDKFIVFFHHKEACMRLQESLSKDGVLSGVITGDVPMEERNALVNRFQTDPRMRVIIGTIGAMGTGVTLTASSTVLIGELDWRPGIMCQAEDRAHRIGQTGSVLCQYFLFEGSVDSKMIGDVIQKMANLSRVLDAEGEPTANEQRVVRRRDKRPRRDWEADVANMTNEMSNRVHAAIRAIAAKDKDMARERNNMGFSKFDAGIGHRLASKETFTKREAAFAKHLAFKYRRQLDGPTVTSIWGT